MKYAVIGTGRTGQAILDFLPKEDVVAICNTRNPATKAALQQADVGIVFVPGKAMGALLPLLLETQIPMVIGTTGYDWPADLDRRLRKMNTPWVIGQNFSLGLNVMRYYAQRIKASLDALRPDQLRLRITEKHHVHKLDAPSGTAIYLARSLDFPQKDIVAIREGEVKGTHTVFFDWPQDRITLTHEALDRASFAEGVRLACAQTPQLESGLHRFEKLADGLIEKSFRP